MGILDSLEEALDVVEAKQAAKTHPDKLFDDWSHDTTDTILKGIVHSGISDSSMTFLERSIYVAIHDAYNKGINAKKLLDITSQTK